MALTTAAATTKLEMPIWHLQMVALVICQRLVVVGGGDSGGGGVRVWPIRDAIIGVLSQGRRTYFRCSLLAIISLDRLQMYHAILATYQLQYIQLTPVCRVITVSMGY